MPASQQREKNQGRTIVWLLQFFGNNTYYFFHFFLAKESHVDKSNVNGVKISILLNNRPNSQGPRKKESIYFDNNTIYQNAVKLRISNYSHLKISPPIQHIQNWTHHVCSPNVLLYLYLFSMEMAPPSNYPSPKPELRCNAGLFPLGLTSHIQLLTESYFLISSHVHVLLHISLTTAII